MDIKQDIIKRLGPDIADNDKPTEMKFWQNGSLYYRHWRNQKGDFHRDNDLPAYEHYWPNGNIKTLKWYRNGRLIKKKRYGKTGKELFSKKDFKEFVVLNYKTGKEI